MQLFSKKLSLLAATMFAATTVFSAQETTPKEFEQGYGVGENQMMGAYNSPGRIDVNGALDIFITGSFLYWTAKEKGLEVGARTTSAHKVTTGYIGQEYKPGFKVDLGINLDHDSWVLDLEYTRIHLKQHGAIGANTGTDEMDSFWTNHASGTTYNHLSGHWRLRADLLDLKLGRPFYLGTYLTVRPSFGFRGGWLNQKYTSKQTFVSGSHSTVNVKQNTWLVGPRAGIGSSWLLGAGFRFIGDVNAGLYFQQFKTPYKDVINNASTYSESHDKKQNILTTNLEFFTGLGYGTYFDHNNWHFDLLIGYNFQIFFDQNRMREVASNVMNTLIDANSPSPGSAANLFLHGLVVTARFDF
ncbi:MAG: Lpg1974 family pore-forming outer membrane protein [Chlamydiota bacterium]